MNRNPATPTPEKDKRRLAELVGLGGRSTRRRAPWLSHAVTRDGASGLLAVSDSERGLCREMQEVRRAAVAGALYGCRVGMCCSSLRSGLARKGW